MDKKYQKILFVLLLVIAAFLVVYLIFGKKIKAFLLSKSSGGNIVNSDISIDTANDYIAKNNISTPPYNTGGADTINSKPSPTYLPSADTPKPNYKAANHNLVLRKGSKGNEVLILQMIMVENTQAWNPTVTPDGKFGAQTLDLLMRLTGLQTITLKHLLQNIKARNERNKTKPKNKYNMPYGYLFGGF